MILRLDVPVVPRAIATLRVLRWHAAVGDPVAFGDVLLELRTEEGVKRILQVDGRRVQTLAPVERAAFDESGDLVIPKPPQHHVEVVASDRGFLREVLAPDGHIVRPGDRLAVLSSSADEPMPDPEAAAAALPFRVVADIVGIGVDLSEDY